MIPKLIVAIVLLITMFAPSTNIKSDNKIIDKNAALTEIVLVDNAIITYYYHHASKLPNSLNDLDTLANINKAKYTFNKISNNKFQLTIKHLEISSPSTNKELK